MNVFICRGCHRRGCCRCHHRLEQVTIPGSEQMDTSNIASLGTMSYDAMAAMVGDRYEKASALFLVFLVL